MRLIDADALKEEISGEWFVEPNATIFNYVFNLIDNSPTVDMNTELSVAYLKGRRQGQSDERPQGEWIEQTEYNGDTYYDCSVCGNSWTTIDGTPWDNGMNFCPNCGAKMKGGTE